VKKGPHTVNAVNEPSSEGTVPVKELDRKVQERQGGQGTKCHQHSPFETIGIK
jgi:hypothetical protein